MRLQNARQVKGWRSASLAPGGEWARDVTVQTFCNTTTCHSTPVENCCAMVSVAIQTWGSLQVSLHDKKQLKKLKEKRVMRLGSLSRAI